MWLLHPCTRGCLRHVLVLVSNMCVWLSSVSTCPIPPTSLLPTHPPSSPQSYPAQPRYLRFDLKFSPQRPPVSYMYMWLFQPWTCGCFRQVFVAASDMYVLAAVSAMYLWLSQTMYVWLLQLWFQHVPTFCSTILNRYQKKKDNEKHRKAN